MAEEYNQAAAGGMCGAGGGGGSGNWWDSTRIRFDSSSSTCSTALSATGSYGWLTETVDINTRSAMDSASSTSSSAVCLDSHKLQGTNSATTAAMLLDPNLQIIGLGLPSQPMDWNHPVLNEKAAAESSYRLTLQDRMGTSSNFNQETGGGGTFRTQVQWRSTSPDKLFPGVSCDDSTEHKQINRGFSLDQPMESHLHLQSSSVYSTTSTWQPKQPPMEPAPHAQLHFTNNAPFWNATAATATAITSPGPPSFLPSFHGQLSMPPLDEKPKQNALEVRETVKKSSSDQATKRPRNEPASTLPPFKVRKEKMGDRITALQQLVSPFGKTDTASVLSEAIEYIKCLHEQVSVLSNPYFKSEASFQHHQDVDKLKDPGGPKQDLRSRGLCLVPVSSTYPAAHETTVDFWTPTFGGNFR
ncbi:hypothetical protein Ancab_004374 [Ancistrocladus abbreviatus]